MYESAEHSNGKEAPASPRPEQTEASLTSLSVPKPFSPDPATLKELMKQVHQLAEKRYLHLASAYSIYTS